MDRVTEIKDRVRAIDEQVRLLGVARRELHQELAELNAVKDGRFAVGRRYVFKRGGQTRTVEVTQILPCSLLFGSSFDLGVVVIRKDGTRGTATRVRSYDLKDMTAAEQVQA